MKLTITGYKHYWINLGGVVSVFRSLSDFHSFALHPEIGRYMVGIGRTFTINMNDGFLQPI